jgi:hypothetical protein
MHPYALIRSIILDSQISITPLGSCTPLHSKVVSQLSKWARELSWMSRRSIYTPHFKTELLLSNSALYEVTGLAGQGDRTRWSVHRGNHERAYQRWPLEWPDTCQHPVSTHLTHMVTQIPLWMLSDVDRMLAHQSPVTYLPASGPWSTARPCCYRYGWLRVRWWLLFSVRL